MATNNYTLGRGKVYFSRFKTGTRTPEGFMYMGNTPEFSLTIESETLDHFSSDEGIREKDDSVPLQVTRTGSLITDNINPANVALFFFGTEIKVTQLVVASDTEDFTDIKKGAAYQLGLTESNPTGLQGINSVGFGVEITGGADLVVDVDFKMNYDTGLLQLLDTSVLAVDGADITVTYAVKASTRDRIISGSSPVEGAMKYVAFNPKGKNFDYMLPYVKVTPNGDYALKGDEWQQIPFTIEALKPTVGEAIYMDGRPVYS